MTNTVAQIENLSFRYKREQPWVLQDLIFKLLQGQRYLLIGANGAGKTTLLRILAGQHMLQHGNVTVLDRPVFDDCKLVEYVRFIGGQFKFEVDLKVKEILNNRTCSDPKRRKNLMQILEINPDWHMHTVSDGQRKRVQLLLNLEQSKKLLLLDEVTTDLDVIARANLLAFLNQDCQTQGTTIVYATHIFDGLENWATHIILLEKGKLAYHRQINRIAALQALRKNSTSCPLYHLVEKWIRYGFANVS